jgi:Uma2 family endonuclease
MVNHYIIVNQTKEQTMHQPALKYITPEEYLAREEAAEFKSEYYQGEIFAMAGTSSNHNLIVGDVNAKMTLALSEKGCVTYMLDLKLWIKANGLFTYPDLMVVCGAPQFYQERDDTILNPVVIVEVLSKSTKDYDRGEKFKLYRSIPTLQEYILIDQHAVHVEQHYLETARKWVMVEYNQLTDVLKFAKIDFQISLQDIYRRVKFAEPAAKSA